MQILIITRSRHAILIAIVYTLLLCELFVDAGATSVIPQIADSDDDEVDVKLPNKRVVKLSSPKVNKFALQLPERLLKVSQKARARDIHVPVVEFYAQESSGFLARDERLSTSTAIFPSLLDRSKLNSGLALIAIASFVSTSHGTKAFTEMLLGSFSALAIVWVPTLLVHGGWLEFLGMISFFAHRSSRRFVMQQVIPKMFGTVKKLFVGEIWRRIWATALAPLPKRFLVPSDYEITIIPWLPDYVKSGLLYFRDKVDTFILSTFKGSVQKSIHGSFGIIYDSVSNTIIEVSLYEESLDEIASTDNTENSGHSDDEETFDEPQLVCDGDSCRFE